MGIGAGLETLAESACTLPLEAAHHQRIVVHRRGQLEQLVQFLIVLVGRALEPRADHRLLRLVEGPEVPLELQHGALPLIDHEHSLALR